MTRLFRSRRNVCELILPVVLTAVVGGVYLTVAGGARGGSSEAPSRASTCPEQLSSGASVTKSLSSIAGEQNQGAYVTVTNPHSLSQRERVQSVRAASEASTISLTRAWQRPIRQSVLHTVILHRRQHDPATREYIARRAAEGKTSRDATRILKRYLARPPSTASCRTRVQRRLDSHRRFIPHRWRSHASPLAVIPEDPAPTLVTRGVICVREAAEPICDTADPYAVQCVRLTHAGETTRAVTLRAVAQVTLGDAARKFPRTTRPRAITRRSRSGVTRSR
jgi:hypothetical protein